MDEARARFNDNDLDAVIDLWRQTLGAADGSGGQADLIKLATLGYATMPMLLDSLEAARARNVELEAERERDRKALDTLTRMANRAGEFYETICALIDADPEDAGMLPSVADQVATEHRGLRARVAELENFADRVRSALDGHPRCDIHADDDVIGCGWKRAVASVQWAVDHAALDAMPASAEHDRAGEIETLRARVTKLEAERDRNAVDPEAVADEFGIQGLTVEDGVATLTTAPTTEEARDLVLAMSLALGKMLDDDQATNYIETEIKKAGRPAYVLNVRRAMGQTPHELRRAAEARVAELEAQHGELVGYTVALRAPGRAEPFAGLCLASGTTYDTADHAREVAEQVDGMPAVVRLLAGAEPSGVNDRG